MTSQTKIGLGAALSTIAGAGIALSAILGWTSLARPRGFTVGFVFGIAAGTGIVLAVAGLLECRRRG